MNDDQALLRAGIDARVRAVRQKDVEAVLSAYAPDVVTFDLVMPLENRGVEAVRRRLRAWFDSFETAIDYEQKDMILAVAGDVAFDHHLTRVRGTNKGGQRIDMGFRETIGYRKVGGTWKVTHQQSSVPLDMTTMKGRIDLVP